MRHSFEENIQNLKNSLKNMFKDCNNKQPDSAQLLFDQIADEGNTKITREVISHKKHSSQSQLLQKIKIAFRNSSVAHEIEHREQSHPNFLQQCLQNTEIFRGIENEISMTTCQKVLNLQHTENNLNYSSQDLKQSENAIKKMISDFKLKGILLKYSPSMFGGWSARYCTLQNNKFRYLQTQFQDSHQAGVINFDVLKFKLHKKFDINQAIEYFQIKLQGCQKSFIFKAQTKQSTNEWCERIQKCISETSNYSLNIQNSSILTYPRFWRKDYISAIQFSQIAQTGDILLYRGKKPSAILQRKMTQQEYDHVGVILKNSFNEILVFEANGGFGVGICPWKKFIKNNWSKDYQIVTHRKLDIQRNEQFNLQILKFVQDNIGKQYKFALRKFILNRTSTGDDEKTTYFCSSLVAKLYKKLALLDPNISSNRYFPSDFAEKKLKILSSGKYGDARLENEKIIVFGQVQSQNIRSPFIK